MKRKINGELFFEFFICLSLGVLLFYMIASGKIALYVHPRLNGFLWVTAGALIVIALFLFRHALTPKHNARPMKYLLFLLPLIASVLIPTGEVQSKAVSLGGSAGGGSSVQGGKTAAKVRESQPGAGTQSSSSSVGAELPREDQNGVVTVTDEGFAKWYQDINQNMKKYEGKTLKFKGQVFRMEGFAADEIVPVRYAMVCCTADLQPCGLLSRGGDAAKYKDGAWVWVTGKIRIEEYQGQTMPVCYTSKIEPAEKAEEAYIYFTY